VSSESHRQPFRVASYEVDPGGRLQPRALCAFLQEAAGQDIAGRGWSMRRLLDERRAWVLHRLRVEVREWPQLGDGLVVETMARRFTRVLAERDFVVTKNDGGELAVATSRWAIVDFEGRRPIRLPDEVRAIPARRLVDLGFGPPDLPEPEPAGIERRYEVRRGDLDVVRHVNNTRYVEWALESVPDGVLGTHECAGFEIVFRRESGLGASIVSRSRELGGGGPGPSFAHGLAASGEELARAESRWRPGVG
jgi:medium-chain acyl-[acyl-carrier-protein] hydrolase